MTVFLFLIGILLVVRNALSLLSQALQQRRPLLRRGSWLHRLTGLDRLEILWDQWIREQQQHSQEEHTRRLKAETILNQIQEGVLILDDEHQVVLSNPALATLLGGRNLPQGTRIERVLSHGEFLNLLRQVRHYSRAHGEIEVSQGEGRHVFQITGTRFAADKSQADSWLLFVFRDITQQHRLEQVRRDFVANVSHELRTPLTIIKGYVETIQNSEEHISKEDRLRFLQKIAANAERLHHLLEDLLELSRLEGTRLQLERTHVDFNQWLTAVAEDFVSQAQIDEQRLQFSLDTTVATASIDPTKLSRVVENLLENAFQYSTANDQPVRLVSRREGDSLLVSVCDKGRGIPEKHQSHIFERFYRVDKGRARTQGGSGLGLSIAKHTVQIHGGTIWVESREGEGTCIHFRIPIHSPQERSN